MHRRNDRTEAPVGMRSRASGTARLDASFCCCCERALALSELRLLPISLTSCSPLSDVRCRIAQERVQGARPYPLQRHGLIKLVNALLARGTVITTLFHGQINLFRR